MTTRQIPWPRILAEGAAIVVSILLAFWIQAWWDGVQESAEEGRLLVDLRGEFQENRTLLDAAIQSHERHLTNAQRLLEFGASQNALASEDLSQDAYFLFVATQRLNYLVVSIMEFIAAFFIFENV